MNVRFWGTSKENPILEIELQTDKKSKEKSFVELKKMKNIVAKNKR